MSDLINNLRNPSIQLHRHESVADLTKITTRNSFDDDHYRDFKILYFRIQKIIKKRILLSFKYEQLKQPEIHSALVKPVASEIKDVSKTNKFYGEGDVPSQDLLFVLLLLRYEFLLQSKSDPVKYELLLTKANICEIITIRMLREYDFTSRVDALYQTNFEMSTLELAVLSHSKKFLSHPAVIQILSDFHEGNLIIADTDFRESYLARQTFLVGDNERVTFSTVRKKCMVVPRLRSTFANLRIVAMIILYFCLLFKQDVINIPSDNQSERFDIETSVSETLFWCVSIWFVATFVSKVRYIGMQFFHLMVWNYVDLILCLLYVLLLLLRFIANLHPLVKECYINILSVIPVLLFPRALAVFDGYEFFTLILISFRQMVSTMIGLLILFFTLISGFFLSFVSLSVHLSKQKISFDMLKILFGYTPVAWSSWKNYTTLGKILLISYLFIVQFLIVTLLVVVLSDSYVVFSKTSKEEYYFAQAVRLTINQRVTKGEQSSRKAKGGLFSSFVDLVCFMSRLMNSVFIFPLTVVVFLFERSKGSDSKESVPLKFTFFDEEDLFNAVNGNLDEAESILTSPTSDLGAGARPLVRHHLTSASTDSLFIDEILHKRYGQKTARKPETRRVPSTGSVFRSDENGNLKLKQRLDNIEALLHHLVDLVADEVDEAQSHEGESI